MSESLEQQFRRIHDWPGVNRYLVAFSGGLDSTVLLHLACRHLLHEKRAAVRAIHVHHGLHGDADQWAGHCKAICDGLNVPIEVYRAEVKAGPGVSPEAAARNARYRLLERAMQPNDALLMAHHADDQAETMLMRLARGAGVDGLAGIPTTRPLGPGILLRPLLFAERKMLQAYAVTAGLSYLTDPANSDSRFDRNYLRLEVLPRLKARWPALPANATRSAGHLAEAARLLTELAQKDFREAGDESGALSVQALRQLRPERLRNLLRHWISLGGYQVPSSVKLEALVREVIGAADDAVPRVDWEGAQVRRFRDRLCIMSPLPEAPGPGQFEWSLRAPLRLPGGLGSLAATPAIGQGLACSGAVTVRFRRGGERLRPMGQAHHRELRKLFQEHAVAPWMRDRIPLVYCGEELAAVADLWVAQEFAARGDTPGVMLRWHDAPPL